MTARQKRRFIRELTRNVTAEILGKVDQMPVDWDGHELRRYVADQFEAAAWTVGCRGQGGRDYRARTRAYRNAVLTNNL